MKTLKNGLKQENVDSIEIKKILTNYSKRDCVKVALYAAEDCFHINPIEESQICIDLVQKWLEDEKSVTVEELRTAANAAAYAAYAAYWNAANAAAYAAYWNAANAAAYAVVYFSSAAAYAANAAAYAVVYFSSAAAYAANAAAEAARSFGDKKETSKLEEYLSYARLFAYEDLNFPYKDFAKAFNLDNLTDLNIFLDFLTDNYPEAITCDREEYFTNKLAKEYLRVIYQ